jgi:hypothetical protein
LSLCTIFVPDPLQRVSQVGRKPAPNPNQKYSFDGPWRSRSHSKMSSMLTRVPCRTNRTACSREKLVVLRCRSKPDGYDQASYLFQGVLGLSKPYGTGVDTETFSVGTGSPFSGWFSNVWSLTNGFRSLFVSVWGLFSSQCFCGCVSFDRNLNVFFSVAIMAQSQAARAAPAFGVWGHTPSSARPPRPHQHSTFAP